MSIFSRLVRRQQPSPERKRKCGDGDFRCGKCKPCKDAEDSRWTRIWEEKYGKQEEEYYTQPQNRRSLTPSTMDFDLPIDEGDYSDLFVRLKRRSGAKADGKT